MVLIRMLSISTMRKHSIKWITSFLLRNVAVMDSMNTLCCGSNPSLHIVHSISLSNVNGIASFIATVLSGVPQGSVIYPVYK